MNNEHQQENTGETQCTCDGSEEIWTKANADKQSGTMIKNDLRRLRVDIFKIVLRATTAGNDGLTQYEIEWA